MLTHFFFLSMHDQILLFISLLFFLSLENLEDFFQVGDGI
jgi:hypothetical protein